MKENNPKSEKSWLKWFFVALILLVSLLAYVFFKFDRDAKLNRENMLVQQEKMISFWKSEGLSQEEIDQKLKEQRSQSVRNENPSIFQSVFRTVRHATGTGPGTGMR